MTYVSKIFKLSLPILLMNASIPIFAQPMECHDTIGDITIDLVVINKGSQYRGLEAVITVDDRFAKLSGHFYNLTQLWDGHLSGLMTNEGISIRYDNNFGSLGNVDVTAYVSRSGLIDNSDGWIRSFHFENCKIK